MSKIKKFLAITLILVLVCCFSPIIAFGTESGGSSRYATMEIEYRYTEGEPPDIPDKITQYGRTYHLSSQSGPVLESTLPQERTYSYRVTGALTEEQLASIPSKDIVVTPVYVTYERQVDVEVVFPNNDRPAAILSNDVDDIPKAWLCRVTSGSDPSGFEMKSLQRAGVTYELSTPEYDKHGLPSGYVATVIYRGLETYSAVGYYNVDATFTTKETEGNGLASYIIVAEYRTDEIPPQENELIPVPVEIEDEPLVPLDKFTEMINNQGKNPLLNLIRGYVPWGGNDITGVWSFLSMIFSLAGIAVAVIYAIGAAARRGRVRILEKLTVYDEGRLQLIRQRGVILRLLTIISGIITCLVWLYVDDFDLGMVWLNAYTRMVGVLFAITIALCVVTNIRNQKIIGDDTDEINTNEFVDEKSYESI